MWRAQQLRRRLQEHYMGLQDCIHAEVLELDAMLLTYEPDCDTVERPALSADDHQWTDTWWRQLHSTHTAMDDAAGLRTRTTVTREDSARQCLAIDLDTPPPALDERDLHDLQLQEQQEEENERRLIELFDEYQAEQAARRVQEEDDAALQAALQAPLRKRHRLQVNVTVSTSSSSSTARLHVAAPQMNEGVQVALNMRTVESQVKDEPGAEADNTVLMQGYMGSSRATTTARLIAQLQSLLATVHPGLRAKIIAKVKSLLQGKLRVQLCQARILLD